MQILTHSLILGTITLLISCGKTEESNKAPMTAPTRATTETGHGHSHGNQPMISESLSIAGITLDINVQGSYTPGTEYHIEMALVNGKQGATVRLWIGDETGVGSMKTKADSHGDHYHAHVLAPIKLGFQTALWIEVQATDGQTGKGRIELH